VLLLTEHIKEGVTVHGWYGWYNLKLASWEEKRKIKLKDVLANALPTKLFSQLTCKLGMRNR